MKIVILLMCFCASVLEAQLTDRQINTINIIKPDTTVVDSVCIERGHIMSPMISMTLMHCPPRTVDLKNSTIVIYHDQNIARGVCQRCGLNVSQPVQAEPDTVVIWRRKDE